MNKIWSDLAWDEYLQWQMLDKKTLKKINAKAWSRRIDHENRLVYNFDAQQNLLIISCKGHYED